MKSFPSLRVDHLVLSSLFCLMLAVSAFSQADAARKPSIAIIPLAESGRAQSGAGTELADFLIKELAESDKFTVVDKSKSAAAESDLKIGPKDTIDQSIVTEIGRKTGAQFLVLGNVSEYGEKVKTSFAGAKNYEADVKFSLRAVDASTAEVIFSQTFTKHSVSVGEAKNSSGRFGSKAMQDAVTKSVKEAASAIVKRLASPPATE